MDTFKNQLCEKKINYVGSVWASNQIKCVLVLGSLVGKEPYVESPF